MQVPKIRIAKDGPEFSRIVQGLWRLADWRQTSRQTVDLIHACLELGITTFDHADIYGGYTCESLFGDALAESSIARESIQLVTKCGIKLISPNRPEHTFKCYDTSAAHIRKSVDTSLQNLRTDYIDLLLIHRPDPLMDAEETAGAFIQLKESGKVRYFGVSNFLPGQFELLASKLCFPLVTNQIEYSVLNMNAQADGSVDLCQKLGIAPMAWSPIGGGRLFGPQTKQISSVRKTLMDVGDELGGAPMDQVALAWILTHPVHFLPILGTGKIDRIQSAVESLDLSLTREQWFAIWQASAGCEIP
jgi:predicted oxidoreductase